MNTKTLFSLSLIPPLFAAVVTASICYASVAETAGQVIIAWDSFFSDLMPMYLGITGAFCIGNILYVARGKRRYDVSRNVLYNVSGVALAIITYATWILAV